MIIAFRLSFARVFCEVVASHNIAGAGISVSFLSANACSCSDRGSNPQVLENLMEKWEATWATELPPPVVYCNPLGDVVGTANSRGWKRKHREYLRYIGEIA